MVNKTTIGAVSAALGITATVLISMLLAGGGTEYYFCEDESSIMECPGKLSGGQGTRCYLDENKTTWDYCSSGWYFIEDYDPDQATSTTTTDSTTTTTKDKTPKPKKLVKLCYAPGTDKCKNQEACCVDKGETVLTPSDLLI
jgi:hypothetical protein